MAPTKEKSDRMSHAAAREQLLKEEELIKKAADFAKLVRRWERGKAMCQARAAMEDRSFANNMKKQTADMREELHFANKQLLMVRQAALRHLLRVEHLQYQLELNHLGKSFYVERL